MGPEAFAFVVLEVVECGDLIAAEQRWIDDLKTATHGFNQSPSAGSNTGTPRSPELCARLSDALNAYWADPAQRRRQSAALKGVLAGARNPSARLNERDVLEIRRLKQNGATLTDLTKVYGVSKSTISHIITRRNWPHI